MHFTIEAVEPFRYDESSRQIDTRNKVIAMFEKLQSELDAKFWKSDGPKPITNSKRPDENVSHQISNSNESAIEEVAQTLDSLRKQVIESHFEHRTTYFKRIDRDVFKLMIKLDDIDVEREPILKNKRKNLVTEIHEIFKLMDQKVVCKIPDCIVCKTGIQLANEKIN